MPETSIILRTKNEEKWVGECLRRFGEQTYRDFEIIAVDSGSTDRTLEIVKNFDVKLFQIRPEEFSYPYALNYGASRAAASKYLVILSAHSLPISKTWLQDGLADFTDEKIMGVYGFVWALPDGSIWEKLIFNEYLGRIFRTRTRVEEPGMGVLGFTNAIIRKELWDKRHFNEAYGLGGEDGEWAGYWFGRGYCAVRDWRFSVYHSHGLNLKQLKAQWAHWLSLDKPQPFKPLTFRKKR